MTDRFGMGLVVLVGTGVLTATAFAILAPLVRSCSGLEAFKNVSSAECFLQANIRISMGRRAAR